MRVMGSGLAGILALAMVALGVPVDARAQVVISQVYGGGGNSGAPYKSDFIELHNNSASAVNLDGWSVQYASATGTSWARTNLSGNLAAGAYYLVKQADGTGAAPDLPTPDATGTIAMSGTAGKVAVINSVNALAGACPGGTIDFVGFGATANCSEGSVPTPAPSNTLAVLRADGGCTDTNNNGADFASGAPSPRNTATALKLCGATGLPILSIQDAAADEGNGPGWTFSAMVLVTLSKPAGPAGVTFNAHTSAGTALPGFQNETPEADYIEQTGWSVTIAEGLTAAAFVVPIYGDTRQEADETLFINLTDVTGAIVGRAQAAYTIVNDDVVLIPIHDIQGSGSTSPRVNQLVSTTGTVTGRKSNGFFLQASDAQADADPATSEGVFVFTGSVPPASAESGNQVRVTGTVVEYVPTADPGQPPLTEIGGNPSIALLSTNNPLPTPVVLSATFPDPAGSLEQLERVEGMRVTVPSLTVVAPTEGNTNESSATGTTTGILHAVVTGVPRPMREPGIQAPDPAPAGSSIPPIPRWDFNPELMTIDSDSLGGPSYVLDLPAGAVIEGLTGPMDFGFRRYTIHRDPTAGIVVSGGMTPTPVRAATFDEFTVGAYNMERFFDTDNDPAIGEPVLTAAAFANRLSKASLAIRNYLRLPDILLVVEMENLTTLQAVATRVNADAAAAGLLNPQYVAYLQEGNDVGGIDVGFLVKTQEVDTGIPRVQVMAVTQQGKDTTWVEPSGTVSLLNDRPPLVLDALVHYPTEREPDPITVIGVHQRSLNDADSTEASGPTTLGDRVRRKRQRQAEYLATLIQQMQVADPARRIAVLGDFNAFAFNDGLADTMNVVTGTPTPDNQTAVPGDGLDLVDRDLVNLSVMEPQGERYSFVFGGNAQSLDHVLANEELILASTAFSLDHARINADFPEVWRNDANSPVRLSDHDPVVAYFESRPRADLSVSVATEAPTVLEGEALRYGVTVTNLGPVEATSAAVGFALNVERPRFTVNPPAGWTCDAPIIDIGATSIACVTPSLANGASVVFAASALSGPDVTGNQVTLSTAVNSPSYDSVKTNDQASIAISVGTAPRPNLGVELSGPPSVPSNQPVADYTASLSNHGSLEATSPVLLLSGPTIAPASLVSVPPNWECNASQASRAPTVVCSSSVPLAAGSAVSFGLSVAAPASGDTNLVHMDAAASSGNDDADKSDNTAVIVTPVLP
jgi:predicted extracellular nuclease